MQVALSLLNWTVTLIDSSNGQQQVTTSQGIVKDRRRLLSSGSQVQQLIPSLPVQLARKALAGIRYFLNKSQF